MAQTVFVNNADAYLGNALCVDLGVDYEVTGTLQGGFEGQVPPTCKKVVSRAVPSELLKHVTGCSTIVYDLHSCDLEELEFIVQGLKMAEFKQPTQIVLVSSVNTWARTPVEAGATLGEKDYMSRIPSAKFAEWKFYENLVLSLNVKNNLKAYVVGAGIMYGNGELALQNVFRAAWMQESSNRIVGNGENVIPTVHVRDVARMVSCVLSSAPTSPYLLCTDQSGLTQKALVSSVVGAFQGAAAGAAVPNVMLQEAVLADDFDVLTLDLKLTPGVSVASNKDGEPMKWWSESFDVSALAGEFSKWLNLKDLRIVSLAPAGFGGVLNARVPTYYGLPVLTQEGLVAEYVAANAPAPKAEPADGEEATEEAEEAPVDELYAALSAEGADVTAEQVTTLLRAKFGTTGVATKGYFLDLSAFPALADKAALESVFTEAGEAPEAAEPADGEEAAAEAPEVPRVKCAFFPSASVISGAEAFAGFDAEEALEAFKANPLAEIAGEFFSAEALSLSSSESTVASAADDETKGEELLRGFKNAYTAKNGHVYNFLASDAEIAEAKARKKRKEAEQKKAEDKKVKEQILSEEDKAMQKRKEDELRKVERLKKEENAQLEQLSEPLRDYMSENVTPVLTEALIEICKVMPDDPVDYLAEYLFTKCDELDQMKEAAANQAGSGAGSGSASRQ